MEMKSTYLLNLSICEICEFEYCWSCCSLTYCTDFQCVVHSCVFPSICSPGEWVSEWVMLGFVGWKRQGTEQLAGQRNLLLLPRADCQMLIFKSNFVHTVLFCSVQWSHTDIKSECVDKTLAKRGTGTGGLRFYNWVGQST